MRTAPESVSIVSSPVLRQISDRFPDPLLTTPSNNTFRRLSSFPRPRLPDGRGRERLRPISVQLTPWQTPARCYGNGVTLSAPPYGKAHDFWLIGTFTDRCRGKGTAEVAERSRFVSERARVTLGEQATWLLKSEGVDGGGR